MHFRALSSSQPFHRTWILAFAFVRLVLPHSLLPQYLHSPFSIRPQQAPLSPPVITPSDHPCPYPYTYPYPDPASLLQPPTQQYTLTSQIPRSTAHLNHICAFLRDSQSPDRDVLDISRCPFDEVFRGDHACVADHGGGHVVYGDAAGGEASGEVAAEALEAGFGCRAGAC